MHGVLRRVQRGVEKALAKNPLAEAIDEIDKPGR
jgi:hypothetical protein